MNRKTSLFLLIIALLVLAVALYFGGQNTARQAAEFQLTIQRHQIDVILSLTPHG